MRVARNLRVVCTFNQPKSVVHLVYGCTKCGTSIYSIACDITSGTRAKDKKFDEKQCYRNPYRDIIRKYIVLLTAQLNFRTKIQTEVPSDIKVSIALFGFVAYGFRNRKIKWRLNVSRVELGYNVMKRTE